MHLEYTGLTPDGQVSHRLAATPNAFALHAEALLDRGMVPLPIAPHSKRPGVYAGRIGEWAFECRDGENVPFVESHFSRPDIALGTAYGRGIEGWQRYTVDRYRSHDAAAEGWDSEKFGPYGLADHFGEYSRMPEVGLGVLCGNGLVGLDIDSEDPALLESIRLSVADVLVDGVYVAKRGRRGFTIFFRGDVPTGKIKIAGREDAIDILATGRQSILPPTTHASSGEPYVWLSERTLFDTEASELPPISAEILAEIRAGLVRDGFDLEVVHERCEEERRHRGDGVYSDLNARALADIGAWVEDLGLYGGKWVGSRYAAVATWRPSGTGRSLTDRKLNLSVSPDGIKDFGDDVGYTPIGLVSTALGLEGQAAALWLSQRVGRKLPPLSPDSVWLTGVDQPFTLDDVEGELRRTNRRFVKRIVPQQQAREARLAALVGTDGAIVEAMRRFVDQSDILNERRAEMERREAELVARERELEAMEDEARLVGYKVGGLVELHEIRSNGAASDREFAMYVNLAKYDNPACLEALQYKEALIAEAKELSSAYPLLVESPSPGSGKTKIIAEEILAPKDIHAMVMSPINSLGWDLQARSPARAWAGLGADGPDGEPLCRRRDEAQRIEAAGGSRRKLCEGCLFFDGCPGRRMIDSWHEAPSIAGTHAHLMLGRPDEMACDVDAVVIDESPVGTLRPGHKRIELADIVLHGDEAGSLAVFRLQNVIRESVEGVGVRQADLSRLDRAGLKAARKALYRLVAERYDMSVEDLMAAEPVAKLRRLIGLLEAILYRPCDGERRGDIIKQSGGVMLSLHGELAVWAQGKAVLLATATPEPDDVLADVMSYTRFVPVPKYKGGAIELDTTPVTCRPVIEHMPSMDLPAGKNVTIRRYTGVNMSARGLGLSKEGMQCRTVAELEVAAAEEEWPSSTLRNRRAELERRLGVVEFLRRESMGGRRVVVVATAEIRIWLAGHSLSVDYLPWGKAIGSNSFENYDALVVLGSKTEPVHVRHMRACDYTGEWSDKHGADPVSDHLRSAELHQAVERLRTRRGKAKPVTVHIFDDSPLPISIEEVDGRKLLNSILLDLESQRSIKIAGEIGRAGIAPVVNDSGAIPARPFRGADCFAVGRPGLMAFHGLGKREAERCAKELAAALLQGYVIAEVTLRAEDGARRVGGWTRFAVREGADAIAAVQGLTGRRVEKVRPRPRS